MVEVDRWRGLAGGQRYRARRVLDERLQVEHFKDPVEADQRGHHVDLDIGQRRNGPVEPAEQRGERDERADLEEVVDDENPAEAVDRGGRQRREQRQRDE